MGSDPTARRTAFSQPGMPFRRRRPVAEPEPYAEVSIRRRMVVNAEGRHGSLHSSAPGFAAAHALIHDTIPHRSVWLH